MAWGSPESPAAARAAIADVEAFCANTGYPQTGFDAGTVAAAGLLRRVGHGDIAEMGALPARAVPPVEPSGTLVPGPEFTGRVVTYRWPTGGPPEELLDLPTTVPRLRRTSAVPVPVSGAANRWPLVVLGAGRRGTAAAPAGLRRIARDRAPSQNPAS